MKIICIDSAGLTSGISDQLHSPGPLPLPSTVPVSLSWVEGFMDSKIFYSLLKPLEQKDIEDLL